MDTIITAVLTIVVAHLVWGFILWLRVRKLYSYPGLLGFPVFGNLYYFYKTLFAFTGDSMANQMIRVNEKYGKDGICFHFIYGYKIAAIVSSPEIVKKLSFHPNLGDKPFEMYGGFRDYMKGPLSTQYADEVWKLKRKEYNTFLRKSNVNNDYFNSFAKSADKLVDKLSTSSDGHDLSLALTQDVSFKTLFGIDTDLVYHPEVMKVMSKLMDMGGVIGANSNIVRAMGPILKPLIDMILGRAVELRKLALEKIENTLLLKKKPLSDPSLMMHMAARLINSNASQDTLILEIQELLITSAHSIAAVLSSSITILATEIDVQERAWKEQYEIFGNDTTRDPTVDDLERMNYLDRFIKESLRFLGPPFNGREANGDINIDGITIPSGTIVIYLYNYMRSDSKYWNNPKKFDPDRFLEESDELKYIYTPFGIGIRNCPGMYFATTLLKITLSKILRRLKIRAAEKDIRFESLSFRSSLLTEVSNHPRLQVEERK